MWVEYNSLKNEFMLRALGFLPSCVSQHFAAARLRAPGPGAILGLAMFEVTVNSTVALDQLFANAPDLFHNVVHVTFSC
jgi:hypothetical protein